MRYLEQNDDAFFTVHRRIRQLLVGTITRIKYSTGMEKSYLFLIFTVHHQAGMV